MADLSANLQGLINAQIMHELRNANIYLQISSYFAQYNLNNLQSKFKSQADDERGHADRFISFLQDRIGGKVAIGAVEAPGVTIDSLQAAATAYLEVEKRTTTQITSILSAALAEGDHMTYTVLQGMIEEQYNEENEAMEFANKANMISQGELSELVLWDASLS